MPSARSTSSRLPGTMPTCCRKGPRARSSPACSPTSSPRSTCRGARRPCCRSSCRPAAGAARADLWRAARGGAASRRRRRRGRPGARRFARRWPCAGAPAPPHPARRRASSRGRASRVTRPLARRASTIPRRTNCGPTSPNPRRTGPARSPRCSRLAARGVPGAGDLNDAQQSLLLRYASAASQAGDAATLRALRDREDKRMQQGKLGSMFRLLTADPVKIRCGPAACRGRGLARARNCGRIAGDAHAVSRRVARRRRGLQVSARKSRIFACTWTPLGPMSRRLGPRGRFCPTGHLLVWGYVMNALAQLGMVSEIPSENQTTTQLPLSSESGRTTSSRRTA